MSQHKASVAWQRKSSDNFLSGKYSREHTWTFDGGMTISASPSPSVVPIPYSNPEFVDPEEAFVASISSCHMLTYLYLASRLGLQILSYKDTAIGTMTKNEAGIPWINRVVLTPKITYDGNKRPTPEEESELHHQAHEQCFVANSVKTEIVVT